LRELVYLKNRSPRTIRSYRQAFASLQQSLQTSCGSELPTVSGSGAVGSVITKAQLQAWVVSMRERGMAPGGCNAYIRAVNAFTRWLNEQEGSSLPRLPLLKTQTGRLSSFSDADVRALLSFRPASRSERRCWTLACTLVDTGIRVEEGPCTSSI
jgi:hypothetical protein